MITLMEMLKKEKADPAHGRPLSLTQVYMTNVMARKEAKLLALKQKQGAAIARRQRKKDLYEEIAKLAKGEDPKGEKPEGEDPERRCAKSVPAGAAELGQQALGFPPLDGTGGTADEAEAAINAILSEERKRETF